MIEPSNEERANLPDVTRGYIHDLEQERDTLNWDRAQLTNRAVHAEQQLAEARRQVAALVGAEVNAGNCPQGEWECSESEHPMDCMASCRACWAAWAAQQAKEGGQ
jgi:hypothetical protein